jgi:hypothetical protein
MTEVQTRRPARGGGGAARRAERGAVSFETAQYIRRNIPNFEVLTEEALEIIETNAETILAEIGVNFVNNPAGPCASAMRDRAQGIHPTRPQPRAQCGGGRQEPRPRPRLRPALRA